MAPRKSAAAAAAPVMDDAAEGNQEYPKALYKANKKDPNGYDAKRAEDPAGEARLKRSGYREADDFFKDAAAKASDDE